MNRLSIQSDIIKNANLLGNILEVILRANNHRYKIVELVKEIEKRGVIVEARYKVQYKNPQFTKHKFKIPSRLVQNIWIDFLARNNELISVSHYRIKVRASYSVLECLGRPICHINKETNVDTLTKFLFDEQITSILMRLSSSFYFNDMKATYFLDKYTRTKNGFERFKNYSELNKALNKI